MPKKLTQEEFVARVAESHPNLEVLGSYVNDKSYVKVRC